MGWLDKVQDFAGTIYEQLETLVEDITKLDVTTMTAEAVEIDVAKAFEKNLNFQELSGSVKVAGITRIDIDGDIQELLKGDSDGKLTIDPELLKIHKENVATGVETWNRFFRNLVEITAIIAAIIEPNDKRNELIRSLKTNLEPLGQTKS